MNKKQREFVEIVWSHYNDNFRAMPWREAPFDPYKILVAEIMLQQTQVDRVIPKFNEFIGAFPSVKVLAQASLEDVLRLWSGLGYNRRAKYLHEAAKQLDKLQKFPQTVAELTKLRGVGPNTAAAVLVYSYNQPQIFVETNIRTAYFYHFFANQDSVDDKELRSVVEVTMDTENPREWYWALMDYGSHLKKSGIRNNSKSNHYSKQSSFAGSRRQLRGEILRRAQAKQLVDSVKKELQDDRTDDVIEAMKVEGLITIRDGLLVIA